MEILNRIKVIDNVEIRSLGGDKLEVKGLLPTNSLSEILYSKQKKVLFKEVIKTGAFSAALEKWTPKILVNHSYELLAEFTEIKETSKGLEFIAIITDDSNLKEKQEEIKGLSFGFVVESDLWSNHKGENIREIFSFKEFIEISILVGMEPAYSSTTVVIVPEGAREQLSEVERMKLYLRRKQLEGLKKELLELKID